MTRGRFGEHHEIEIVPFKIEISGRPSSGCLSNKIDVKIEIAELGGPCLTLLLRLGKLPALWRGDYRPITLFMKEVLEDRISDCELWSFGNPVRSFTRDLDCLLEQRDSL